MKNIHLFAIFLLIAIPAISLAESVDEIREKHRQAVAESIKKFPIEIPPASAILPRLKTMTKYAAPAPDGNREERSPQSRMLDRLTATGSFVPMGGSDCFRSIPTRDEFLHMMRRNPADANQIMKRCNLDTRDISPPRQLPSGVRQLPEDTRQRPVGTWSNR